MYTVNFLEKAYKSLNKLDNKTRLSIIEYLDNPELLQNPKNFGKRLSHSLKNYWRYRVGKYRILCEIKDNEMIVLVAEIDHRDKIYD